MPRKYIFPIINKKSDLIELIKNNDLRRVKKVMIQKENVDFYQKILLEYKNIKKSKYYSENMLLYHLTNNIKDVIQQCKCNNEIKFLSFYNGYNLTCGDKKCYNENRIKTCKERYGVKYVLQDKNIKTKSKNTIIKNYGNVKSFYKLNYKKTSETKLKKYNNSKYNNPKKIKETCLIRYGVDNISKLEKIKIKLKVNISRKKYKDMLIKAKRAKFFEKQKEKIKNMKLDLIAINKNSSYIIYCNKCEKDFFILNSLFNTRYNSNIEICTVCNPLYNNKSILESDIFNYIKQLYNGNIIQSDKTILKGKELDIYLPEYNVAIEFNGLYWHSELFKDKQYHLNKTIMCKKQGIRLVHIFEDEWLYKQDIVKSRIKNILNITTNKIYARKCIIKNVDNLSVKQFLNNNHIEGFIESNIKL